MNPVPSQRLSTGELAFLAAEIPALGSRVFHLLPASAVEKVRPVAKASGHVLENSLAKVTLDPSTGDIVSLIDKRSGMDFVNTNSPYALNTFRYLRGGDAPSKATGPTDIVISVKDSGPVIASLLVESRAEGCRRLTREIRLIAGQPHVEIIDTVDKIPTRSKEGVHFAFAFNVPNATTHMDIPWGVMDPLTDQLPGANKNWLAFQRWIDVSNDKAGVTWVGIEAAIVQFGDITANIMGGNGAWIKDARRHAHDHFMGPEQPLVYQLPAGAGRRYPLPLRHSDARRLRSGRCQPVWPRTAPPAGCCANGREHDDRAIGCPGQPDGFRVHPQAFRRRIRFDLALALGVGSGGNRSISPGRRASPKSIQCCLADEQPRESAVGAIGLPPQGLATLRLDW